MNLALQTLTELPLILSLSFAVYLSFEYWRFPDLTVETVFVAGMVSSYMGATGGTGILEELAITFAISFVFVCSYSLLTFTLFLSRFPPLFAGLVVLLAGYSVNFFLNGKQTSQAISPNRSELVYFFKRVSPDGTLIWLWAAGLVLVLLALMCVFVFDKSKTGAKLRLSRQIDNRELVASFSRAPTVYLFIGMLTYNSVAVVGGIAWGLSNATSSVESLGLVTVGLATMFLVRAMRSVAAAPSRTQGRTASRRRAETLLLRTDKLAWIFFIVLVSSVALSVFRFETTRFVPNIPAVVNALTAASIIAVWMLVLFAGSLMGRQLPEDGKN